MEKIYCIMLLYIFEKPLVHPIICDYCGSNDEKTWKVEESIEILKFLGLIDSMNE